MHVKDDKTNKYNDVNIILKMCVSLTKLNYYCSVHVFYAIDKAASIYSIIYFGYSAIAGSFGGQVSFESTDPQTRDLFWKKFSFSEKSQILNVWYMGAFKSQNLISFGIAGALKKYIDGVIWQCHNVYLA